MNNTASIGNGYERIMKRLMWVPTVFIVSIIILSTPLGNQCVLQSFKHASRVPKFRYQKIVSRVVYLF